MTTTEQVSGTTDRYLGVRLAKLPGLGLYLHVRLPVLGRLGRILGVRTASANKVNGITTTFFSAAAFD
jgi:hypothetical protein